MIELIAENAVISVVGLCFMTAVLLKTIATVFTTASRERSRREIAAYIAEGSISAEQGERLIRAQVAGRPEGR